MRAKLGQVFIKEKTVIDKIMRYACVEKTDHVIEIGCGEGVLTRALASAAKQVTVIELDQHCIDMTRANLGELDNLYYIHQDVLKVDFSQFDTVKVVANIPYYLSAKLIQKFAYQKEVFSDIVIMVQKEFAKKLVAPVGSKDYTSLAVFTNFHFELKLLFDISKNCFKPVPKVDSTMLLLRAKNLQVNNPELLESLVKACFWGRRKKISTALRKNPHIHFNFDVLELPFVKENPDKRADHLSLPDYLCLYDEVMVKLALLKS
jgi:16S rRNA (adenine1518-N6/adenine1519-N6)-dimethyltransferase